MMLRARAEIIDAISTPIHPGWLRYSSVSYLQIKRQDARVRTNLVSGGSRPGVLALQSLRRA